MSLNKFAYGYPAELIGEVTAFGSHKVPVQYKGNCGFGEIVFDVRIGKFYATNLNRYGDVGDTYGTSPHNISYWDDLYKEIYVDIVRKTAKKHDIKLPDNDPNFIRSMYTFTEDGTILGPGFTEVGGPAKCKTCGDLNEYVSPFRDYECKKCRMMADWAKSAEASKSQKILALAHMYSIKAESLTIRRNEDPSNKFLVEASIIKDLYDSMSGCIATLQDNLSSIKHLSESSDENNLIDVNPEDIKQMRDFSGHLSLLCNMILNGEEYSEKDKKDAIEDNK